MKNNSQEDISREKYFEILAQNKNYISVLSEIKDSYFYFNSVGEVNFNKILHLIRKILEKYFKTKCFIYKEKKFLLILDIEDDIKIRTQFKRIKRKFKKLNSIKINSFKFSNLEFYIGISLDKKENLIKHSSIALSYVKKNNLKNMIFTKKLLYNMKDDEKKRKEELVIKKAVLNGNIIPYYQKIINNETLEVFKYEALARINYKNKVILPSVIISAIKNLKLEDRFTREILKNVFLDVYVNKKINSASVNINVNDITNKNTWLLIKNLLQTYGGENITFEIVETIGVEDYSVLLNFTKMIKEFNSNLSIDDFGSGHSGYEHLINLDIDYLKIDGKFIKNLKENLKTQTLIKGLCTFSKEHNIKIIAEFVEDEETYNLLKEIGVHYSQGYFFGKPTNITKGNI